MYAGLRKIINFVIQKCLFFISIIFCIHGSVWVRHVTITCSERCSPPTGCDGCHSGSALTMTQGCKTCIRPSDRDTVAFSTFVEPEQPITREGGLLQLLKRPDHLKNWGKNVSLNLWFPNDGINAQLSQVGWEKLHTRFHLGHDKRLFFSFGNAGV